MAINMKKFVRNLAWISAGAAAGVGLHFLSKKRKNAVPAVRALKRNGTCVLETDRLILREFTLADAQSVYDNWASDPEVTKYLTWHPHKDVDETEEILSEWVERYGDGSYYNWAIELKELREPIGSISVVEQNDKVRRAHIGYCIGRAWWHEGIMTEALGAVIEYLFSEGYQRIDSRHDPRNPHSGDVMKKCGMQYEGTLRNYDWNNQGPCDACFYSILKEDHTGGDSR